MSIKQFAEMLNGRTERNVITSEENKLAMKLSFVVVYGYSDDNMIFAGAIDDEIGCFNGGSAYVNNVGLFEDCECECCYSLRAKQEAKEITAIWHNDGEYSWTYETDIPHATFDVLDDEGEKWCKGIVFDLNKLQQN